MRINEPDVVFQAFDDEVVLINLVVGKYYSTSKVGADVLGMAAAGASLPKIQELLEGRWDVVLDVSGFLLQLVTEGLLVPSMTPDTSTEKFPPRDPKLLWVEPKLDTHDDMQALLLLDPIHDVSEQGWPNK